MDPLSVAASVVGLLSVAAKIFHQLRTLWTGASGAPKSAQEVLLEVSTISVCLSQMQSFLLGTAEISRSRTSILMVEQVLVCLTDCVSTFSELEKILDNLGATQQPMRKVDQFRWALKESVISKILGRLQAAKLSLNLMLTTLTWYDNPVCTDKSQIFMATHKVLLLKKLKRLVMNEQSSFGRFLTATMR